MYRIIKAARSAPLYHGTSFENAISIIETNELRGNVSNETESYGVSTTRSKNEAYSHVAIILDQEKLSYNYKIHPVYRDGIAGKDLAEERLDRTIKNIRKYILGLQFNNPTYLKSIRRILIEHFGDMSILDFNNRSKGMLGVISKVDKLIETAHHYNISLDKYFLEVEKYLTMFKNGEYDEEYAKILQSKGRLKRGNICTE